MRNRFIRATTLLSFVLMPLYSGYAAPTHEPTIEIATPPPEARDESSPGDRNGYRWSKGFWGWNGKRHVWYPGYWVKERVGYKWIDDCWQQHGEKWQLARGHYEEDPDYEPPEMTEPPELHAIIEPDNSHEFAEEMQTAHPAKTKRHSSVAPAPTRKYSGKSWVRIIHH
jgi:hypothetical protein